MNKMANSIYAVKEGERCPRCGYRRNEYPHFRTCVPRQKWPTDMQGEPRRKRVVVDGLVYDADKAPAVKRGIYPADVYAQAFPLTFNQAVSGEASSPVSVAVADLGDDGSSLSPEAAPNNQMIYVEPEVDRLAERMAAAVGANVECECGWTGKSLAKHRAKAHKES